MKTRFVKDRKGEKMSDKGFGFVYIILYKLNNEGPKTNKTNYRLKKYLFKLTACFFM